MSSYKTNQRRVRHRGREFHFVSYEGVAANAKLGHPATQATWFLMCAGKRWDVMTEQADLSETDLDQLLSNWLDANIFASKR